MMHIIRTDSAGVHLGEIKSMSADKRCVTLANAVRIWRWRGANTLHELALHGSGAGMDQRGSSRDHADGGYRDHSDGLHFGQAGRVRVRGVGPGSGPDGLGDG
jgi:hypothetical protein